MKGLFIVFHGFSPHSGISKKIFAQCEALRRCGVDIALCHTEIDADGTQRRLAGDAVIRTFGSGLRAKALKRVSYTDITGYIRRERVEFLYIRHDLNANPLLVGWLRSVRRLGVRIALEIPTYPYDAEFREARPEKRSSSCKSTGCSAVRWPARWIVSSPSPTTRRFSGRRPSASPTASTSTPFRSKPNGTTSRARCGCWRWPTSTRGTASTA